MKKAVIAVVGVLLTATAAQAEHKLLITDVLEPKQIEAQATFEYSHSKGDVRNNAGVAGTERANILESVYSLGVGVGHDLEVTAFVPYVFSERGKKEFPGEEPEYEKHDGVGDFALEAKYLLLGGEEKPVSVVTGLGLKFDTAGRGNTDAGTGSTDVSPFIAASMNLPHHHIPYASYRATLRNNDNPDTHTLTVGLEKEFNHTFTLDAKAEANFNTASRRTSAGENYVFELGSYIQMAHNFYLLPSVAYTVGSTSTSTEELPAGGTTQYHHSAPQGVRAGLGLYYLF